MISSLILTSAISVSSIAMLGIFKLLDMFEKEPWIEIFKSFVFGAASYFIGLIFFLTFSPSKIAAGSTQTLVVFVLSWLFSLLTILSSQVIFSTLLFKISRKNFDSLTDYILYFCCFGIGFDWSERVSTGLLSSYAYINNKLTNILFSSAYTSGGITPFLMASIGFLIFFIVHKSKFDNDLVLAMLAGGISTFAFGNIAFYAAPFVNSISSPHVITPLNSFSQLLTVLAQNLTLVLLTSAIGSCVIFDMYLLSEFKLLILKRLENVGLNSSAKAQILLIINELNDPILQFCSSYKLTWSILIARRTVVSSRRLFNLYSRLALTKWLRSVTSFELEDSLIQQIDEFCRNEFQQNPEV